MILPAMIVVYVVVKLKSSMTNVMHVMLVILTFLHVEVRINLLCITRCPPLTQIFIKLAIMFIISIFSL